MFEALYAYKKSFVQAYVNNSLKESGSEANRDKGCKLHELIILIVSVNN